MNDYLWANPVGRIRFIEKTLLTRSDLMRVLEAPTLESAQSVLRDSYYGPYVSKLDNANEFEPALEAAMRGIYEGILEIAPEPIIIDAYRARYDFHNLKALLKAEILGIEPDEGAFSALGNFDIVALGHLVDEARTEDTTVKSRKKKRLETDDPREKSLYAIGLELKDVYRDIAGRSSAKSLSPFEVDSYIDKSYYSWIGKLYQKHGYYFLIQFIQREIDILNMKMLMRSYRLGISPGDFSMAVLEGGTIGADVLVGAFARGPKEVQAVYQGSELEGLARRGLSDLEKKEPLTRWEKECDDAISRVVKEAGKVALGPEPIFGYVFGREIESKNLRIIFSGKQSLVPESKIRERLREGYA
ncbi:MAG: V-type ATPase subunit [Firmicutes bacterium]|nr:V-type ATPase subunit [Candidatus Fermentithermobacillaceae bacterium]